MSDRPLSKKISHIFEFLLVRFVELIVYPIPFAWLHGIAQVLSFLLLPILPAARLRIENNLKAAFKEMSESQMKSIVKKNFVNTLRMFLEVYQTGKFKNKKFLDKYIHLANDFSLEHLQKRQKGIVVIQGHLGNWELPIIFYHHYGVDVPFSLKHQSNPYVDKLMLKTRQEYGGIPIFMEQSDELLKYLKKGSAIGLVADQDAGPGGVFVDFVGRKASTFPGPALLAYLIQTEITLLTCLFKGAGHYEINLEIITKPIKRNNYKNRDEAVQILTQTWASFLEKKVIENKEQYFWMHRRWKTQPKP